MKKKTKTDWRRKAREGQAPPVEPTPVWSQAYAWLGLERTKSRTGGAGSAPATLVLFEDQARQGQAPPEKVTPAGLR